VRSSPIPASRRYALIFDQGDEAVAELSRFARETGVNGASLSGVGAASSATLGWFDFAAKSYDRTASTSKWKSSRSFGDIATTEDGTRKSMPTRSWPSRGGGAFADISSSCT